MAGNPTASVTVGLAGLDPARSPQICLKTGTAAQCLVPTRAVTTPSWAWVLILAGGAPFFIARRWIFPSTTLSLPARNLVFEHREAFRRGSFGVFAVIGVVALYSAVTLSIAGMILSIVVAAGATAGWRSLVPRFWVDAELDGERVTLTGVHPDAARAFGGRSH